MSLKKTLRTFGLSSFGLATLGLATSASLALVACGGDDGDGGDNTPVEIDPNGTHTKFVVNNLTVPKSAAEASAVALDLNGDGRVDNALGGLLGALVTQADLDLQTSVDEQLDDATFSLLVSMQATSLANANGAGAFMFFGENPMPAACTDPMDPLTCGKHLAGDASFDIAANSPTDAKIGGLIAGGAFSGGPGKVSIELPLGDGAPLRLDLIAAYMEVDASDTALMSGKLSGAITEDDVNNELMPAVQVLIANIITDDCTPVGEDCGCVEGSTAITVLNFFDTDGNCEVPLQELNENSLIGATILNPDLDLLDETGAFNPGVDGIDDSLSIGIGFTAVPATFTLPAGI